ncbi:hypothetical protein [Bernardetia sp.]|uniref:hypothetical protein n=1 Tax=Bernardetia sp. TaxID=1937974 RepID=UPI0025BB6347|nr:hypothetical protein [Bernardetia sp.]
MKQLSYLLLIFLFISCNQTSETNTSQSSEGEQISTSSEDEKNTEISSESTNKVQETKELKTIEDIREEYKSIVSKIANKKLDSISFQYECYEEGGVGGEVSYFSENGSLRVIKYFSGYDHGGISKEYFLKDAKPFFIYKETSSWNFDVDAKVENATRDDITENRFYIIDGKLIQCLEKKFTIRSSMKNNPTSATVANKEVECSDLSELLQDFELVLKYRNQTEKMECL